MTITRKSVAKGAGALFIRQISTNRILFLNTNTKYALTKSTTEGDKVQGFNDAGDLQDLDVAGSSETYELDITSKKNTRNINELTLNSAAQTVSSIAISHSEYATVTGGTVTLNGGTPLTNTLYCSYLDGEKLTLTGSTPTAAGTYKDNADGTVTFNAADNGKQVVFWYQFTATSSQLKTYGGATHQELGYVDVGFYQIFGTSDQTGKVGAAFYRFPKCTLSGESTLEFSDAVQDKEFKLTCLLPDSPAGFKKPYLIVEGVELNNTNGS